MGFVQQLDIALSGGKSPLASAQCGPASILNDLLQKAIQSSGNSGIVYVLVDGLESRCHQELIKSLQLTASEFIGRIRFYVAIDDSVPLLPGIALPAVQADEAEACLWMQDLCFTEDEILSHFVQHGRSPSKREISKIHLKTDGIPAAVELMLDNYAESLAHQCLLLTQWIDNSLLKYLEPMEPLRLASLSLMPQFTPQQAAGLLGLPESEIQHWLELYCPVFFIQQPSGEFIWSQLLQQYFYNKLTHCYRDLLPKILQRVEPWLASAELTGKSLDVLLASVDRPWARNILVSLCKTWFSQRNASSVISLLERITKADYMASPDLILYYSWALIVRRRIAESKSVLHELESGFYGNAQPSNDSELRDNNIKVLRALANVYDQPRPAYSVRVRLLEDCLDLKSDFQGDVMSLYANMLHSVGVTDLSKSALLKAIAFHQNGNNLVHLSHAKMLLWYCEFNEGLVDSAVLAAEEYVASLEAQLNTPSLLEQHRALQLSIAMIKVALADFLYEKNQLDRSRELYNDALPELEASDWNYVYVIAMLGKIKLCTSEGAYAESFQCIDAVKTRIEGREPSSLNAILCFETMRILRCQGKSVQPVAAQYQMDIQHISVESLFMDQYSKERLHWVKCHLMVLLEQKNYTSALIYSIKGLIKSLSSSDTRFRVLFTNIKALCEFKVGDYAEARATLNSSMQQVQKNRFMSSLTVDDFGWVELWAQMDCRQDFTPDLVPRFISEIRMQLEAQSLVPQFGEAKVNNDGKRERALRMEKSRTLGLTEKEYEILTLLAEGLCNKKIASRSEIALTTVKWHLQNIFGKLQARNRTEAVVKAQEHAILGKN